MTLETYLKYCKSKPGVTDEYPFDGECAWLKVMGKLFSIVNVTEMKMGNELIPPFYFANLKCDPERAEELRSRHPEIKPGWHQNKKYWNSIMLEGSLRDNHIKELIDHSYELVVSSMTKKQKEELTKYSKQQKET